MAETWRACGTGAAAALSAEVASARTRLSRTAMLSVTVDKMMSYFRHISRFAPPSQAACGRSTGTSSLDRGHAGN